MIDDLARDVLYALRMFRREPGFVAAAVLSLALGIGANTAMFTTVERLMFRPLPVRDPSALVVVQSGQNFSLDYAMFEKHRERAALVADLSAVIRTDRYNVGIGENRVDEGPVRLALVSGTYFSTLGINAALGRTFGVEHDRPGFQPVAVISDSYWKQKFARAPDAIGRTVMLNGDAYEIVGVAPRGFTGEWIGRPADLWIPIVNQPRIMLEIPLGLPNTSVLVTISAIEIRSAGASRFRRTLPRPPRSSAWRGTSLAVRRATCSGGHPRPTFRIATRKPPAGSVR